MPELLLELLSEEIPARMQARAAEDLRRLVCDGLKGAGLSFTKAEAYATPRRLALVVDGIPAKQPDVSEERRGPRADAPSQAIDGFKRSLPPGAKVEIRETEKGKFHFACINKKGEATAAVLPGVLAPAINTLSWPKSMKWESSRVRWVRPLHQISRVRWVRPLHQILCVFDSKVVANKGWVGAKPFTVGSSVIGGPDVIGGGPCFDKFVAQKNISFGGNLHETKLITVKNFADYKAKLKKAKVILDAAERRQLIEKEAAKLAAEAGLKLKRDPALLDEVAGLVEWPVVRMGTIDEAFMALPPELLTTVMRHHQKYFALTDARGRLAPRFVVVLNTETRDKGKAAVAGNERVLRARLADAKFFWDQDRKRILESRVADLGGRVFHAKLGSVLEKARRIGELARGLAKSCKANPDAAARAAKLCKADLSTGMVGEFPELQGVIGRYYALNDGEKPDIADAVADHYSPQGPGDDCPKKPISITVALADKIDTLVGFWSIGEKPTGSRDPFALRRAALGVIRLILENEITFAVTLLIEAGWKTYPDGADHDKLRAFQDDLRAFMFERLKVHLRDKGTPPDLIDALFAGGGEDDLLRIVRKAEVLKTFLKTDDGANLLVAYRRANNIVAIEEKKDKRAYDGAPDEGQFRQEEERILWRALNDAAVRGVGANLEMAEFESQVQSLAGLRKPVDDFFDRVTVNAPEPKLRENRLRLLARLTAKMNGVAQFSQIQGGER